MKKVLAFLLAAVILFSLTAAAAYAETQTDENESETGGYFIIGTMTDWKLDQGYRIGDNKDTYYFTLYMEPEYSFKIVYSPDGKTLDNATYYPEGRGNAFNQEYPIILKTSFYSFIFRPTYDGGTDYIVYGDEDYFRGNLAQTWYYNCIYIREYCQWWNGKIDNSNPDPEHKDPEPGYYIVGTMTD